MNSSEGLLNEEDALHEAGMINAQIKKEKGEDHEPTAEDYEAAQKLIDDLREKVKNSHNVGQIISDLSYGTHATLSLALYSLMTLGDKQRISSFKKEYVAPHTPEGRERELQDLEDAA